MANEVINPYQLYRDNRGRPLAAGTLRILTPGTSSLGTAFSDSALTTPQIVDGYKLDAYGRVAGDLRWSGLRDVEVYSADGAFIRKDSGNVTLVDASVFAINLASVAAMIANTTLVVGDVVETQSYNANQGQGGARYLIVAGGTGTADSYRFHNLNNGLQAQLIDQEANNNPYVAGAVGDGVADDTLPVQRLLTIGGDIDISNGIFAASALTLSVNARVAGNGTLRRFAFSNADLITISGTDLTVVFDGVTLDGNLSNQSALQDIAVVRSTVTASAATTISLIHFNGVRFQGASRYDVLGDGNDNGFPVLYSFVSCSFIGGEQGTDAFSAASIHLTDGVNCVIRDCYWNLAATVTTGRPAIVTGTTATALTNPGYLSVSESTFIGMGMELTALADSRGVIHADQVRNLIVQGNRILTPQVGGIVFDAGVDTVTIADNLIDALATSMVAFAAIAAITSTNAAPGDNWLISGNIITGSGAGAIDLNGASAGADASRVQILGNLIDAPTLAPITFHNLQNVQIQNNYINLESLGTINAIVVNTDGVAGEISIEGNEITNVGGTAILATVSSTAASFLIDGNTLENVATACIDVQNALNAVITNNALIEAGTDLIRVGTLTNCHIDGNSYLGTAPTNYARNLGSITNLVVGENLWQQVDSSIRDIAVTGSNITAGPITSHAHRFTVTGATSIDTLQNPGIDGWILVCQSDGAAALTFNDALGNLNLAAATRVLGDATDTLTLVWNQVNSQWSELAFSNN